MLGDKPISHGDLGALIWGFGSVLLGMACKCGKFGHLTLFGALFGSQFFALVAQLRAWVTSLPCLNDLLRLLSLDNLSQILQLVEIESFKVSMYPAQLIIS